MTATTKLPVPNDIAQQHSEQLLAVIKQAIVTAGGKISFADYMNLCLYSPGLGYYSAGSQKIGHGGDFTTAPEISPLFSRTLAHHVKDVMQQLDHADILEFGAGSGKMAVDILLELHNINSLPDRYFIIEASADLRLKQQKSIEKHIPELSAKICWLEAMPDNFSGVIVANEVCDAMPVHLLEFTADNIQERYIELDLDGNLQWCDGKLSQKELHAKAKKIHSLIESQAYITEVNLHAEAWINSIADTFKQGAIFIIDYGYPETSYYHPERSNGTLMCYYQHHGHDDPFVFPGLQDITAHVDFTSLAQTAHDKGLEVSGFQNQADFLIAGGITELASLNETENELALMQQTAEIKRLTLPSEMGENFKVLTLTYKLDNLLPRIQLRDQRYRL